jgi:PAS domain S-box-containing protein
MPSAFSGFISEQGYMPHGMCFLWQPGLITLHAASDAVIAISYYSMPIALAYFALKRTDLAFRGIFFLSALFILACGTTHVMGIWTLWRPDYWLDGGIKLLTAVVSIGTAFAMWRAMPLALAVPSTGQLERANRSLHGEMRERQRAERALHNANAELERRVAERTASLEDEVAQRRRTEQTLRESEERWRSMFEASAVGIALTDNNRRFVAANEAFERMTGYTGEELRSLGPVEITHEDDRDTTREALDEALAGRRRDYQVEKRYVRKDGTVIWVRVSTARAPEGGLEGIPTIVEDITERKRAEDALHAAREALVRVSRLTTMGELSTSIAHEINQPLAAISANANACRRLLVGPRPDLDEAREMVDDIANDAVRASEVIRRIRGLVKNAAPDRAPVDINDALKEVLALARHELQRHEISVRTDLGSGLRPVMADRIQLQQVVLNLVMNAIDAMRPMRDRTRLLAISSRLGDKGDILVSVEDSGVGLDPALRERVFDTFFTTKADGIGMGLSISSSIVRDHGGRLWADTGSSFGAVFRFTLPAMPEPATTEAVR